MNLKTIPVIDDTKDLHEERKRCFFIKNVAEGSCHDF